MKNLHNIICDFINTLYSNKNKKIIIWGTEEAGEKIGQTIEKIGIIIDFFINEEEHKNKKCLGKNVFPLSVLNDYDKDAVFIIIADKNYMKASTALMKMGYRTGLDFMVADEVNSINPLSYGNKKVKKFVDEAIQKMPIFKVIEIETINRCNGDCSFCPVNKNVDKREFKLMEEDLFDSILLQLKELNYDGQVGLYSNNEPFMDNRLINFLRKTKKAIPLSYLYIITNGTLITMEKFMDAISLLDALIIDNYSDDYEFVANVKEIYEYCKNNPEIGKKVNIIKRKKNQVLYTRGGQAPNSRDVNVVGVTCSYPFHQMVVRPDGKVSLCCNDAMGKNTLGDLQKEKIIDIWHGEKYKAVRNKIASGRENFDLCKNCDSLAPIININEKHLPRVVSNNLLQVWG